MDPTKEHDEFSCEHYEQLKQELEALYGEHFGDSSSTFTMTDIAGFLVRCVLLV